MYFLSWWNEMKSPTFKKFSMFMDLITINYSNDDALRGYLINSLLNTRNCYTICSIEMAGGWCCKLRRDL